MSAAFFLALLPAAGPIRGAVKSIILLSWILILLHKAEELELREDLRVPSIIGTQTAGKFKDPAFTN